MPHERLSAESFEAARKSLARLKKYGYDRWDKGPINRIANNLSILIKYPHLLVAEEHKDVVAGIESALRQLLASRYQHGEINIVDEFRKERNLLWEILDKKPDKNSNEVMRATYFCIFMRTSMEHVLGKRGRRKIEA